MVIAFTCCAVPQRSRCQVARRDRVRRGRKRLDISEKADVSRPARFRSRLQEAVAGRGRGRLPSSTLLLVKSGLWIARLKRPEVPRSGQGPLRLLHVGRLMRGGQKRSDDLLRALTHVRADWQLDLIGSGSPETEVAKLQAMVAGDRTLLPSSDAVRESVQNFSSPRVFHCIRAAIEHTAVVPFRCDMP